MKSIRTVLPTLLAVLLGLVFCTGAGFAGGASEDGGSVPAADRLDTWVSDETLTFSMLISERPNVPFRDDWLIKTEIERLTNVRLEVMTAPDNDFQTKLNLILSSGNPPDIITKAVPDWIKPFAQSGVILPASDYFDQMPHFQAFAEERDIWEEVERIRLPDGKLYVFPGVGELAIQTQGWTIRKDIFERHSLPLPETYDDMFNSLVALKEIYPEATPISARYNGDHLLCTMAYGFGIMGGWATPASFDEATETWRYSQATEEHRAMLRWLHRAMEAGILDREAFTQDESMYNQKRYSDRVFIDVDWFGGGMQGVNEMMRDAGYEGANWQPFLPPDSPLGLRKNHTAPRLGSAVALTARTERTDYFDELLAFMDWSHYSDQAMLLGNWGVEGVTYEIDENGEKRFLPHIQTWYNIGNDLVTLKQEYGLGDSRFVVNSPTDFTLHMMPKEVADVVAAQNELDIFAKLDPPLAFTEAEEEILKVVGTPLRDYTKTMTLRFIYGDADLDEDWDAYLDECKAKGLDRIVGIYNSAWKRSRD